MVFLRPYMRGSGWWVVASSVGYLLTEFLNMARMDYSLLPIFLEVGGTWLPYALEQVSGYSGSAAMFRASRMAALSGARNKWFLAVWLASMLNCQQCLPLAGAGRGGSA